MTQNQLSNYYQLNLQKGITNVGSNPGNDIVIDDPRVLPFHLIIDHRRKPYKIIALSPDAKLSINGISVAGNDPVEAKNATTVGFNGFTFKIDTENETNGDIEIASPKLDANLIEESFIDQSILSSKDSVENEPSVSSDFIPAESFRLQAFPPAVKDEIILVSLPVAKAQSTVEQTAVYRLSVINAGPIVATFEARVEGVPQAWVNIIPAKLNLNENERGQVEVRITAPRESTSFSAIYPLQFNITSRNYPNHVGQADGEFELMPYHQFSLGNLEPRQKSASYRKRNTIVGFPITNHGNTPAVYKVSAVDDENGLQFEFPQDDQTKLHRQSDVQVDAGDTKIIPLIINPMRRSIFRLRGKQYPYTVRAQNETQEGSSQLVTGTFISQPLFGFLTLLMIFLVTGLSVFLLMRPRIHSFASSKDVIENGQSAALLWRVSMFTSDIQVEGIENEIKGSQGQVSVAPNQTASTYTLVASNWLSRLLKMPDLRSDPVTVLMIPGSPSISTFSVDKREAFVGDTVNVKWSVANADQLYLTVDGITTTMEQSDFNSELPVNLTHDTLLVLEAKNSSGSLVRSQFLRASQPSILIEEFSLSHTTITLGDPVTIMWRVSGIGVESVKISPFEEDLPLTGELTFYPKESMEFVMSVRNRDLEEIRLLPVGVQPPGTPPVAPVISFFKAAPQEIVGEGTIEFSWSVSGQTDKIEITDSKGVVAGGLPAQGFKATNVKATTNFVLTAYNNTATASSILEVAVNPDLMDTQVKINSTIPSSALMRGDTMQVYFSVYPMIDGVPVTDVIGSKLPEVSGKVVVTDGFDTCEAELPQTSCVITINTSGANKKFTATYNGDSHYSRRTSDPYPDQNGQPIAVMGTPAGFIGVPTFSKNPVVPGETTNLHFVVGPQDPSKVDPVTGEVRVYLVVGGIEATDPICRRNLSGVVGQPSYGEATCSLSFNSASTKYLRLKYMGNTIYDGDFYDSEILTVEQGNTQVKFTSNMTSSVVTGEQTLFKVLVTPKDGASGIPTGIVKIRDLNSGLNGSTCDAVLVDGAGECEISFTQAGLRDIEAYYVSDINFNSSTVTEQYMVHQASTTTVFTSFPPVTTVGQTVTFRFKTSINLPGAGTLSGEARVMNGSNVICTAGNVVDGEGTCAYLLEDTTPKSFSVVYDPDDTDPDFAMSTSTATVYTPEKSGVKFISFTSDQTEGSINTPVRFTVMLESDPASPLTPDGTVRIIANPSSASCVINNYSSTNNYCDITFVGEGNYTIKAYYEADGKYLSAESLPISYVIKKGTSVTVVSVNTSIIDVDNSITFQVRVNDISGGGQDVPTGNFRVNTNDGSFCDGTLAVVNGQAIGNCDIIYHKAGSLDAIAKYLGDNLFTTSTSDPQSITIRRINSVTTIESTNPTEPNIRVGTTLAVSVKVVASEPRQDRTAPIGTVTVKLSETEKCDVPVSGGNIASCSFVVTSSGIRSLEANFVEDTGVDRYLVSNDTDQINIQATQTKMEIELTDSNGDHLNPGSITHGQKVNVNVTVSSLAGNTFPSSGDFEVTLKESASGPVVGSCNGTLTIGGTGTCVIFPNRSANGQLHLTAKYEGTNGYEETEKSINLTVNKATMSVTLTTDADPIIIGDKIVYSVTVNPDSPSEADPEGAVSLIATQNSSTITKNCSMISTGDYSCEINFSHVGNWSLKAKFTSSKPNYYGDADTQSNVSVIKDGTTVILTDFTANPEVNSVVQFKVKVRANKSLTVHPIVNNNGIGEVEFVLTGPTGTGNPTVTCQPGQNGNESADPKLAYVLLACSFTPDVRGQWSLKATYPGDTNFESSQVVSPPITVNGYETSITLPSSSTYYVGVAKDFAVTLNYLEAPTPTVDPTFTITPANSSCDNVTWQDNASSKQLTTTCSLSFSSAATYEVKVSFAGDLLHEPSENTVDLIVQKNATSISDDLAADRSFEPGANISIEFTVESSTTTAKPTGQVNFETTPTGLFSGALNCQLSDGACTLSKNISANAPAGVYTIKATYAGNNAFAGSEDVTEALVVKGSWKIKSFTWEASSNPVLVLETDVTQAFPQGSEVTVNLTYEVAGNPPTTATISTTFTFDSQADNLYTFSGSFSQSHVVPKKVKVILIGSDALHWLTPAEKEVSYPIAIQSVPKIRRK